MLRIHDEVRDALENGMPVVALTSAAVENGAPDDQAIATVRDVEAAVRDEGAIPATIGIVDGAVYVGLTDDLILQIASQTLSPASLGDLPLLVSAARTSSTGLGATCHLAAGAGIGFVAADRLGSQVDPTARAVITALSRIPVTLVCSGLNQAVDAQAAAENLSAHSIPVLVMGETPWGLPDTGATLISQAIAGDADDVVRTSVSRHAVGFSQALLVVQPSSEGGEPLTNARLAAQIAATHARYAAAQADNG